MIDARPQRRNGLALPPGGVEPPNILRYLRALAERLHAAGCRSAWMIVAGDTIVGLCSFKAPPDAAGAVEIGYGLNEHFRRRGTRRARSQISCVPPATIRTYTFCEPKSLSRTLPRIASSRRTVSSARGRA